MNSFLALCFLALFCSIQASASNSLDQLQYQLRRSKSNVESIMLDLRHAKTDLSLSTSNKLSSLTTQNVLQVTGSIVDPASKDIRSEVDLAKQQGKDVENCYTTAKNNLNSITRTAIPDLQQCEKNGKQLLQEQENLLEDARQVGQKYINELDQVFPGCYSSNIYQMQSCIAIKLGTINSSIRTYQNQVPSLKNNANSGANQAYLSTSSCEMQIVSKARSSTTDVRIAATRCIKG